MLRSLCKPLVRYTPRGGLCLHLPAGQAQAQISHSYVANVPVVPFSSRSGGKRGKTLSRKTSARKSSPSEMVPVEQAWVEVPDEASGLTYWWNQQTNETTHLGAPKPLGATAMAVPPPAEAQQSGGMMSGLGGVVAQGMAFGAGSSMAHHAVGAIANSFGGGDDDNGGDDSFDI